MFGIIEVGTGKVFATSQKNGIDFSKLLDKMSVAYPSKSFRIEVVNDNTICVGDLPKKFVFEKKKKGSD